MLQRATLAEKEVTSLKEQLANSSSNHQSNDHKDNAGGMDRSSIEIELQAKDKEVSFTQK